MWLKLSLVLSAVLVTLAQKEEDAPFSIGLGTLAPSYRQKFGADGRIQYDFKQDKNGFSFTLGDSKAPAGLGAIPADFSRDLLSIKVPVPPPQDNNALGGQGDIRQSAQTQHASPYLGPSSAGGYGAAPSYGGGHQQNFVGSYGASRAYPNPSAASPYSGNPSYSGASGGAVAAPAPQPNYANTPFPTFNIPTSYGSGIPGQFSLHNANSNFNVFSNLQGGVGSGGHQSNLAAAAFSALSGLGQGQGGYGGGASAAPTYNSGQYDNGQYNSGQYGGGHYSAQQRSGLSAGVPGYHTQSVGPYGGAYGGQQPRPQFLQGAAQSQSGQYSGQQHGAGIPAYGGGGHTPTYGGQIGQYSGQQHGAGVPAYGGGGHTPTYGGQVAQPNIYASTGGSGGFNPPQFRTAQAAIASLAQLQDPRAGGGSNGVGHSYTTNLFHQFQQQAAQQHGGQPAKP